MSLKSYVSYLFWTFINPTVSAFGVATNILSVIAFLRMDLANIQIYQFMFLMSAVDVVYMTVNFFNFIHQCTPICSLSQQAFSNWYRIIAFHYFSSSLAVFNIYLDICISIQRLMLVTNQTFLRTFKMLPTILVGVLIASVYYIPEILSSDVRLVNTTSNQTVWRMAQTEFGQSMAYPIWSLVLGIIRGPVVLVILSSVNLITLISFKRVMARKKRLKGGECSATSGEQTTRTAQSIGNESSEQKSSSKVTRMTLAMSFSYILLSLPSTIFYAVEKFADLSFSPFLIVLNSLAGTLLLVYHSINFFIYWRFNSHFRKALRIW
nr:G protein-coupled receptor [Proales similis]